MTISIAFVDDDAVFCEFLSQAIQAEDGLSLHSQAVNLATGQKLFQQKPADILLVDLGLPDGSGLSLISQARKDWPHCQIMVISVFGDRANIVAAIKAGAAGYLLKGMDAKQIAQEIRVVHQGGSAISPEIAKELLRYVSGEPSGQSLGQPEPCAKLLLSPRELEVLVLANKGLTYSEVANTMGITESTVKSFVRRAYQKLQVTSKTEALYELQRSGKILD